MKKLNVKKLNAVDSNGVPIVNFADVINEQCWSRKKVFLEPWHQGETRDYDLADTMVQKKYVKKGDSVEIGVDNIMVYTIPLFGSYEHEIVIGDNVKIGNHNLVADVFVLGNNVILGDNNAISKSVAIDNNSTLGSNNYIKHNVFIRGITSIDAVNPFRASEPIRLFSTIGANNTIGSYNFIVGRTAGDVTIGNGNQIEAIIREGTKIGNGCFIPESAYIGRNCIIGDNVTLKEFVKIDDNCIIGNNVTINIGVKILSGTIVPDDTIIG